MKTKRKYLARWVQILDNNSSFYKKAGVVMDEEYLHNGIMCCRIILDEEIVAVEAQYLKVLEV
jgi:hypothetical protein